MPKSLSQTKSKRNALPPAAVLIEMFRYDEATGELYTRYATKMSAPGRRVGFVDPGGYLRTEVDGVRFQVHRIIWKIVTGEDPPAIIDHVDGTPSNNRFSNLRAADDHLNAGNAKRRSGTASGMKGVFWCSTTGRWTSQIRVRTKRFHLGRFDTVEEAHEAYANAARLHFGEFARVA